MGVMHAADMEKSAKLKGIYNLLMERGQTGATTAELSSALSLQSASTWVSALRKNGVGVVCKHVETTATARIYRYWLVQYAPKDEASA